MSRLRPEVIVPIRPAAHWARSVLFSCCAFIMFATAIDAMRWSRARQQAARAADRIEVRRCPAAAQAAAARAAAAQAADQAFRARQRDLRARMLAD